MRRPHIFLCLLIACLVTGMNAPGHAEDIAACTSKGGKPVASVEVRGFKQLTGFVRIQLYENDQKRFLKKKAYIYRVVLPVTAHDYPRVCIPTPKAGKYAIFVWHNVKGDKKRRYTKDGFGFSNDIKLGIRKPSINKALVKFAEGKVVPVLITLQYKKGLFLTMKRLKNPQIPTRFKNTAKGNDK